MRAASGSDFAAEKRAPECVSAIRNTSAALAMAAPQAGSLADFNEVWEIRELRRKPRNSDARKILERIARQVRPIMRKRGWRVKKLSEFSPGNKSLLGLNINRGAEIRIRLRQPSSDLAFYPYEHVLGTMLHELAHMARGPHDAQFYAVLDELTRECEDLMAQEITGSAAGREPFIGSGRRLGGQTRGATSSSAAIAAAAAERRMTQAVLSSGPQRLGGDTSLMRLLSPAQAAAMAAERRMQDNAWCGGEWEDIPDNTAEENWETPESRAAGGAERPLSPGEAQGGSGPCKGSETREGVRSEGKAGPWREQARGVWTAAPDTAVPPSVSSKRPASEGPGSDLDADGGAGSKMARSSRSTGWEVDSGSTWSCRACTFLNLEINECELCGTPRTLNGGEMGHSVPPARPTSSIPVTAGISSEEDMGSSQGTRIRSWPCGQCTLENVSTVNKCAACGTWRYSREPLDCYSIPRGT